MWEIRLFTLLPRYRYHSYVSIKYKATYKDWEEGDTASLALSEGDKLFKKTYIVLSSLLVAWQDSSKSLHLANK